MAETPPTWLNREFLEKALRSDGKNPDVAVTSYEIKRATIDGDNYGSEMYRATLKTKENGKMEEISLIIKCQLRGGELSKILEESGFFIKEARTYSDIHDPMYKILKEVYADKFQSIGAKSIYISLRPEAIVLEDLKRKGFRLPTVTQGLDLKHCLLVMRTIALYHASSLVLLRRDPKRFEIFMDIFFRKNRKTGMSAFVSSTMKSVQEEVEKWPGYEHYARILNSLENTAMEHWADALCRDETGFNVLAHGDLWFNNMMFRYSEGNDEVQDVRFVDFQLSYVTSPAIDLMYFMNTSASPEVLEKDQHVLVEEYYNTLCQTLSKCGHQDLQPSKETLISELEKKQVFGVVAALTVRAVALADRNHVPNMEDIIKRSSSLHISDSYKQALKKLLRLYEKLGWLKV